MSPRSRPRTERWMLRGGNPELISYLKRHVECGDLDVSYAMRIAIQFNYPSKVWDVFVYGK